MEEKRNNLTLSPLSIDAEMHENGMFDVWIGSEGCSGYKYTDISSDEIGIKVADLLECLAEEYSEAYAKERTERRTGNDL